MFLHKCVYLCAFSFLGLVKTTQVTENLVEQDFTTSFDGRATQWEVASNKTKSPTKSHLCGEKKCFLRCAKTHKAQKETYLKVSHRATPHAQMQRRPLLWTPFNVVNADGPFQIASLSSNKQVFHSQPEGVECWVRIEVDFNILCKQNNYIAVEAKCVFSPSWSVTPKVVSP